jgi:hypothetical protein
MLLFHSDGEHYRRKAKAARTACLLYPTPNRLCLNELSTVGRLRHRNIHRIIERAKKRTFGND